MKNLLFLLSFLFAALTFAQETSGNRTGQDSNRRNQEMAKERASYYNLQEPSDFTFNNQNFRFTPDEQGLSIYRMENNKEIPVGKLRRTTADGFYIMTSTTDPNDISFGRFDSQGNFRTFKYDRAADQVTEEDYYNVNPRDIRGDNRSDRARERSNNDKNQRNKKNSDKKTNSNNNSNSNQNNNK